MIERDIQYVHAYCMFSSFKTRSDIDAYIYGYTMQLIVVWLKFCLLNFVQGNFFYNVKCSLSNSLISVIGIPIIAPTKNYQPLDSVNVCVKKTFIVQWIPVELHRMGMNTISLYGRYEQLIIYLIN